jgi:hypothetical protein
MLLLLAVESEIIRGGLTSSELVQKLLVVGEVTYGHDDLNPYFLIK